jgi:GNAT superfamily N-acetyltransferase
MIAENKMISQIEVNNIKLDEVRNAAITLFHAFKEDPLITWIFQDKKLYEEKAVELFETWVKYCVLYGKGIKTNDFKSIALRKKPGDLKLPIWRLFRSGMFKTPSILGKEAFKRLIEFDKLSSLEKQKNMGKQLFWYCWVLGTDPKYQHRGYGGALMEYTFEMAKQDQLPCYLETASETSMQLHLHKGYKLLSKFTLPHSDINIYAMLRESR